jgi:hypothetical protein
MRNIALKLETLFTEKGYDPKIINDFLDRVGIEGGAFKSTEAMRQLTTKSYTANTIGTNPFEVIRAFTSG